ncbi:ribonuclease HII [Candidatus Viridilinea mediisalina]|uniref:Ribonuclease HII n=1 Tax=Candidatus Viridilinea mediisalina TaxID=2024553 RepID=A0A2A6RIW9_9CHLR|nr:ribonuclease HII [Candidatus Viridilinea mediisalina]PDW02808.1 ribonuclease HII [Candidatus Viridilinea mediisalina]
MPTTEHEAKLRAMGYRAIAGLDEAGRGCWAGPVVAAAVVLPLEIIDTPQRLAGVNDSKQLTAAGRERGYQQVLAVAKSVGVGCVPAFMIDAFGIVPATRLAMQVALLQLQQPADALLIDALRLPMLDLPQEALIRGDSCSLSIAAASLVAKVTRDRLMQTADRAYPVYGFAAHKGYGTARHQRALAQHGPCALHRRTFAPILCHIQIVDCRL